MTHARFLPGRRAVALALGSLALPAWQQVRAARGIAQDVPPDVSQKLPASLFDLSFASPEQGDVAMRTFLGKPLVLNFWASWCPPCVKEMPELDVLSRTHPHAGFVGLAVDTSANVRRFLEKTQVSYPVLISGHAGIEHMRALGNRQAGLPFTVLFDARGRVQHQILGQIDAGQLDGLIRTLAVQ